VLAELITKQLYGLGRVWLALPLVQQRLHVGAEAGDAEQPGLMVHQVVKLVRAIGFGAHDVDEDPGVEIAAAGAHHEACGRRKAHGGIARLTILHRRQAGAVAQMGDHQATLGCRAERRHDVFIGQTMKAIPSYAFVPEVAGEGEALGHLRHTAVKGGVKTRHLWQLGKACRHRLDALDGTRQV
jgi:hypothetical protein